MKSLAPLNGGALPQRIVGRKRSSMLASAKAGIQSSFAVVGYEGRNWFLKWQGEQTLLRDPQTKQPNQSLEVVIVGVSDAISKIYYEKLYDRESAKGARPDCASADGIRPDAGVPHPQSPLCETCKLGGWGSRITDSGKRAKMCRDSRRIAVVPLADIKNEAFGGPMLMRIPPMSLQALSKYADFLTAKGLDMPWVGTRLGFDFDVPYPKLTFEAIGILEDQELDDAEAMSIHPLIHELFHSAEGGAGEDDEEVKQEPTPGPAPQAPPEPAQEPEAEPAPEPAPEPEPPPAPAAAAGNPFQQAAQAQQATKQPDTSIKRPRLVAPEKANADLNSAINALLDGPR